MTAVLFCVSVLFILAGIVPLILYKTFNAGSAAAIIFGVASAFCAFFLPHQLFGGLSYGNNALKYAEIFTSSGEPLTAVGCIAAALFIILCVLFAAGIVVSVFMVIFGCIPGLCGVRTLKGKKGLTLKSGNNTAAARGAEVDFVIILGCKIIGDNPSKALRGRLDKAAELLLTNGGSVFAAVVSGGKGDDEQISEAEAMRRYLIRFYGELFCGAQGSDILLEDRSVSTEENLKFSMKVIDAYCSKRGLNRGEIIIVTDGFHVLRARMTAKRLGIDCSAIPSTAVSLALPVHWIREIMGVIRFLLTIRKKQKVSYKKF